MQSESNNPTKRIIFIAIGLALIALVVYGVTLAKERADFYANKNETSEQTDVTATAPVEEESETNVMVDEPQEENSEQSNGLVAGTQTTENNVVVPAAGAQDVFAVATVVSFIAFLAIKFVQSRRRLANYR